MSLTARALLRRARDRHPALTDRSTPDSLLLDRLSTLQREVLQRASVLRPGWLQQRLTVALALDTANALGTAGAGVGGLPATGTGSDVQAVEAGAGLLGALPTTGDADFRGVPDVLADDALTFTGQAWTVDEWQGAMIVVLDGPGLGSARSISSNTAETLVLDPATTWSQGTPSAVSVFGVFGAEPEVDPQQGVITTLPSVQARSGYLVKLDAQGNPYLDTDDPLVIDVTAGVPLPPHSGIGSQGTVFFVDGAEPLPLPIVNAAQRYQHGTRYAACLDGDTLLLCGVPADWEGVRNIEVPYTPVPPDVASLNDFLLFPDATEPLLVAHLAAFIASRMMGRGITEADLTRLEAAATRAEESYFATLLDVGRARKRVVREVW